MYERVICGCDLERRSGENIARWCRCQLYLEPKRSRGRLLQSIGLSTKVRTQCGHARPPSERSPDKGLSAQGLANWRTPQVTYKYITE